MILETGGMLITDFLLLRRFLLLKIDILPWVVRASVLGLLRGGAWFHRCTGNQRLDPVRLTHRNLLTPGQAGGAMSDLIGGIWRSLAHFRRAPGHIEAARL